MPVRPYLLMGSMLALLLSAPIAWAQLRLPQAAVSGPGAPAQAPAADPPDTPAPKKRSATDDNSIDSAATATGLASNVLAGTATAAKHVGARWGDVGQAARAGKMIGSLSQTAGHVSDGAKLAGAVQRNEVPTEVANQLADKGIEAAGKLIGGKPGKLLGAAYSVTKLGLENTQVGQAIESRRDQFYLNVMGASDPMKRTGPAGPEVYQAQKLDRAMKRMGLSSPSDPVAGFDGLNARPPSPADTITQARVGPNSDSQSRADLGRSLKVAGIPTDPAPRPVHLNLPPGVIAALAPKPPTMDATTLKAHLDAYQDAFTKKEEERKSAEAAQRAAEAAERQAVWRAQQEEARIREEKAAEWDAEREAKRQARYEVEHPTPLVYYGSHYPSAGNAESGKAPAPCPECPAK